MKKGGNERTSPIARIEPVADEEQNFLNIIVETPKGGRTKLRYEERLGVFEVSKLLPKGMVFPFDFGFVPQTQAEDGDPLDVLVLMEEPLFPGCLVKGRLIGVLEAEQTEEGETHRNDRIIAVADSSMDFAQIQNVEELPKQLVDQIEEFFVTYNRQFGKEFRFLDRKGPAAAWKRVNKSMQTRKAAA